MENDKKVKIIATDYEAEFKTSCAGKDLQYMCGFIKCLFTYGHIKKGLAFKLINYAMETSLKKEGIKV